MYVPPHPAAVALAVAVNVSSIKPLAQLLTQNGKGLAGPDGGAALLFQPVIQVILQAANVFQMS